MAEIAALKEQGLAFVPRQRVSEAVAKIELRRVPAPFAVSANAASAVSASLSVIETARTPATVRNSRTSPSASSTLACRLRHIPNTASKIAIGEVIGDRAVSSTFANASASGSRVRMATMADA